MTLLADPVPPVAQGAAACPKVGISSCLLGNPVRYDGGHQLDRYLTQTLGQYFQYFPVCPEVECGLPVPREAMRLVAETEKPKDSVSPRLLGRASGQDFTDQMTAYAAPRSTQLAAERLAGFIFKAKSPSSGMERVKIYPQGGGNPSMTGVGLFARAFMAANPLVPAEEDGRLHDPRLRENFVERVYVLHRWNAFAHGQTPPTLAGLVDFQTRHKLLVMAHSPKAATDLGGMVAGAKGHPLPEVLDNYAQTLMNALKLAATPRKHVNVLQHGIGYFKKVLTADEKAEFQDLLDAFRVGHVPLVVPVTLLAHFVRRYGQEYLAKQYYLRPHPLDLRLRSAV